MATPAATKKRVIADDRTFIVHFDDQRRPLRVYERVLRNAGTPLEGWSDVGRWVAKSQATPKRGIIAYVLTKASAI